MLNKLPWLLEVEIERLGYQVINSAFFVRFEAHIILEIAASHGENIETIEVLPCAAADAEPHAGGAEAWFIIKTRLVKLMPMLSDEYNTFLKVFDEDVKTLK